MTKRDDIAALIRNTMNGGVMAETPRSWAVCERCGGEGKTEFLDAVGNLVYGTCPECNGHGWVYWPSYEAEPASPQKEALND